MPAKELEAFLNNTASQEDIHELFRRFDANNENGLLSLAEIDKGLIEMWSEISQHKPSIMRAYHAADSSGDGFIQEREFLLLLKTLQVYDTLYQDFELADSDHDRRLTLAEFKENYIKWAPYLDIDTSSNVNDETLEKIFGEIDTNGGGMVLFEEFCMFAAKKSAVLQSLPPQEHHTSKKSVAVKNQAIVAETKSEPTINVANMSREQIHQLFKQFDATNNNGILSLAEIDHAMIQFFPHLVIDKRALMRAYKVADKSGDGFIQEKEFAKLLMFLDIFHSISVEFQGMDTDGDKRVSLQEFLQTSARHGVKKDQATLTKEFEDIDSNHGGFILFDEYCAFVAAHRTDILYPDDTPKVIKEAPVISPIKQSMVKFSSEKQLSHPDGNGVKSGIASFAKSLFSKSQGSVSKTDGESKVVPPADFKKAKAPPVDAKKKSTIQLKSKETLTPLEAKIEANRIKSLAALGLPAELTIDVHLTSDQIHGLFKRFDSTNNNGILSLAEIDKAILELYPQMGKHKRALMRAYKSADVTGDGLIQEKEFAQLLYFLAYYDHLYQEFAEMDTDGDNRLSFEEYYKMDQKLHGKVNKATAEVGFLKIDTNGGGYVLFDEYCWSKAQKKVTESAVVEPKAEVKVASPEPVRSPKTIQAGTSKTAVAEPPTELEAYEEAADDAISAIPSPVYKPKTQPKASQLTKSESHIETFTNGQQPRAPESHVAPPQSVGRQVLPPVANNGVHRRSTSSPSRSIVAQKKVLAPLSKRPSIIDSDTVSQLMAPATYVGADASARAEMQSMERRINLEALEKKRLEASVEILMRQVEELGGSVNDPRVLKHRAGVEALYNQNLQLQAKLNQERQLYSELSKKLGEVRSHNRDSDLTTHRTMIDEKKRTKDNIISVLQKDARDVKVVRLAIEATLEETKRKLAAEKEKSAKLAEEVQLLKTMVRYQDRTSPLLK